MGLDKYEYSFDRSKLAFDFVSEGPNGQILKRVIYTKIKEKGWKNLYNLGFGDRLEASEDIDDLAISDNQDRDKILATVVATLFVFTERYPKAMIVFEGSTASRTRLYQMLINKHYDKLNDFFKIFGFYE